MAKRVSILITRLVAKEESPEYAFIVWREGRVQHRRVATVVETAKGRFRALASFDLRCGSVNLLLHEIRCRSKAGNKSRADSLAGLLQQRSHCPPATKNSTCMHLEKVKCITTLYAQAGRWPVEYQGLHTISRHIRARCIARGHTWGKGEETS